jgi:hypothetical protein
MGFGLVIRFIGLLKIVNTSNYSSTANSHTSYWFATVLLITSQYRLHKKHCSSVGVQLLLSGLRRKHLFSVVYRPLPSNSHGTTP